MDLGCCHLTYLLWNRILIVDPFAATSTERFEASCRLTGHGHPLFLSCEIASPSRSKPFPCVQNVSNQSQQGRCSISRMTHAGALKRNKLDGYRAANNTLEQQVCYCKTSNRIPTPLLSHSLILCWSFADNSQGVARPTSHASLDWSGSYPVASRSSFLCI